MLRLISSLAFAVTLACVAPLQAQTAAAPAAPATSGDTVEATDAQKLKDSIGKEIKVSGKVVNVGSDSRSGNVFLNFSRDRETGFVVMIKGSVAKAAGTDLKEKYNGKDVVVTGMVQLFKSKTEIVVSSLEQIVVK